MEFTSEQKDMAKRLSYGADLFRKYYYKKDSYRNQFEDSFQALVCFSENYAYERQGAAPAYSKIAVRTLQKKFSKGLELLTIVCAKEVWEYYQEIAKNQYNDLDVNAKNNPLNSDNGLITIMVKQNIINLATHVKSLVQSDQTKKAHELIDDVRGIGPKIASLYLRDITYLGMIPENRIKDQYLLQPIDTWIEQALSIIFGGMKPKALLKKQEIIVNLCKMADVSPIAFSQGAWILGSQIARDYSKFQQLAKGQDAKTIIKEHIEERKRYVSDAEQWLKNFPD